MKNSTRMGAGAAVIGLGALVAITPRFLFSICEYNGIFMQLGMGKTAHMPCYYTAQGSYILGLMIGLIGVTLVLARQRESARLLSVVLGGAGLAVMLLPVVYPICMNPDEPCNHGTKPMLMVLGIVTLGMAGWIAFASRKSAQSMSAGANDAS